MVADREKTLVRSLRLHRTQQAVLAGGMCRVQPVQPHPAQCTDARNSDTAHDVQEHTVGGRVIDV